MYEGMHNVDYVCHVCAHVIHVHMYVMYVTQCVCECVHLPTVYNIIIHIHTSSSYIDI